MTTTSIVEPLKNEIINALLSSNLSLIGYSSGILFCREIASVYKQMDSSSCQDKSVTKCKEPPQTTQATKECKYLWMIGAVCFDAFHFSSFSMQGKSLVFRISSICEKLGFIRLTFCNCVLFVHCVRPTSISLQCPFTVWAGGRVFACRFKGQAKHHFARLGSPLADIQPDHANRSCLVGWNNEHYCYWPFYARLYVLPYFSTQDPVFCNDLPAALLSISSLSARLESECQQWG